MTDAHDDARQWAWIAPDGGEASGRATDLAARLRSGALPPSTWVWRANWLEWMPATRVAALRVALPGDKVEPPREPRVGPHGLKPPPRPPLLPPPAPVRLPRPPGAGPEPPAAGGGAAHAADRPSSFGVLGRPRGASVLGPRGSPTGTSTLPRAPQPTLTDDPVGARTTLRPPGAVPPPPRGGPLVGAPRVRPEEEAVTVRRPPPALGSASASRDTLADVTERAPGPPPTVLPSELRPAVVLPGAPTAVTIQPASTEHGSRTSPAAVNFDSTLGSTPFEAVPEREPGPPSTTLESAGPPVSVPGPPPPSDALSPAPVQAGELVPVPSVPRAAWIGIFLLGAVVLLLSVGLTALVVGRLREGSETRASVPSAAVPPVASSAPAAQGCVPLAPAARLSSGVHRAVQPAFAELGAGERVAVGLAETPKVALGLVVNPATLDVERAFEQPGDDTVHGVVPLAAPGGPTFAVDRAGPDLTDVRTLSPGVVLGASGDDWVRVVGGRSEVLWAGAAADRVTEPRVARNDTGHLVTFRRGGLGGRVYYAWLAPDGKPLAPPVALEVPGVTQSGTPDAAAGPHGGLLAFAGRMSPKEPWRVLLATAPVGKKPLVKAFETPPGGAGGGSIAPSVSRLGSVGWILQWTEGTSGKYQVRVQRLSPALEPLGDAQQVSPKGANAGQGAAFAAGQRVLSVFVQTTAGHDELWGASLTCD